MLALMLPASFAKAVDCAEVFALLKVDNGIREEEVLAARQGLMAALKDRKVPAFVKHTRSGDVPVILMNGKTLKEMKPYVEQSLGTQVYMQPDWHNDHGGIRVLNHLIDVDAPGARGYGEIHQTGLAWKPIDSYFGRGGGGSVIIEASYYLTPQEKNVADYYHRIRRAALYRVPFTFGGIEADMRLPNMLESGEHCFVFCKASAVRSHVGEIEERIRQSGVKDVKEFFARKDVKDFQAKAKKLILDADVNRGLAPEMLVKDKTVLAALEKIAPKEIQQSKAKLRDFGNLVAGYEATRDYGQLMRNLGVTGDSSFGDINNARVTAVLIYDSGDPANAFLAATYETEGKFGNWTREGQTVLKADPGEQPRGRARVYQRKFDH